MFKQKVDKKVVDSRTGEEVTTKRMDVVVKHASIIEDDFWKENPKLLRDDD